MGTDDLTVEELADDLRIHRKVAERYVRGGQFPNAFKVGRDWRIPRSDVEAYKAARRVSKPATEPAPAVVNSDGQSVQQSDEKADPHNDGSVPRDERGGAS